MVPRRSEIAAAVAADDDFAVPGVADADPGVAPAGGDVGFDHAVGVEGRIQRAAGRVAEQHGVAGANTKSSDGRVQFVPVTLPVHVFNSVQLEVVR